MKVLIFHGYLLGGTGSNVYNASLAQALAALGHQVHLLCQDRAAAELPWVSAYGEWNDGAPVMRQTGRPGGVTVYVPDIGGLLPVYVKDSYAGFEVKTFAEMSDLEIERYIDANQRAAGDVIELAGGVDAAMANHLVMGAVALARAGIPYALKVHGSDLAYTVLPELGRFKPYAEEAVGGAAGILVGSVHIAARLRDAVDDPVTNAKVRLGPPGVDTALFAPIPRERARSRLSEYAAQLRPAPGSGEPEPSAWGRDPAEAAGAIARIAASDGDRVLFVGKLIVSKGVDLLLAAWPLVRADNPAARLLIVGFGEYRAALERLLATLDSGDLAGARGIAAAGRELEGGPRSALRFLDAFLADPPAGYTEAARAASGSVEFAGRLDHGEVARIIPAFDALVFPSTFPEAFGMVAAEAASAGVLPVSAGHSGALEVSRELARELPAETAELISFAVDERAVGGIAERLIAWLALDGPAREPTRRSLVAAAGRLYGWEGVARDVLAASAGRLGDLPPVL